MPVNAGQHCWKACWGQPPASSNLASSAVLTCKDTGGWQLASGLIVFPWAHLRAHPYRCEPCRCRYLPYGCAWSETSRTCMNAGVHAAEACALSLRAGRDRDPRVPPTTDRITLSDREVLGERTPSRPIGADKGLMPIRAWIMHIWVFGAAAFTARESCRPLSRPAARIMSRSGWPTA